MAGKIRVSKYKHTVGTVAKRETWYLDVTPATLGADTNGLAASTRHIAYVSGSNASSVGVVPLAQPGKRSGAVPQIHAHSAAVVDLEFSPHDDNLLATSSEDSTVRLWTLPSGGLPAEGLSAATVALGGHGKRVNVVRFHPTAANVVATGSLDKSIKLWDVGSGAERQSVSQPDEVWSLAWSGDGSLLAATCKDKHLRVLDPRQAAAATAQEVVTHQGVKAIRVAWLGSLNRVVTTGFSKVRERQFAVWDPRNLKTSLTGFSAVDNSTGLLLPFYDADTNMLFLAGKGDGTVRLYECVDVPKAPHYFELPSVVSSEMQRSVAMLPKRAVDVMACEVDRMLKLTDTAVAVLTFEVPRKTHFEFAADLFPNTASTTPALSAADYFAGQNKTAVLQSLDPAKGGSGAAPVVSVGMAAAVVAAAGGSTSSTSTASTSTTAAAAKGSSAAAASSAYDEPVAGYDGPTAAQQAAAEAAERAKAEADKQAGTRALVVPKVVRSSHYRHIGGRTYKKDLCYDGLLIDYSADVSIKTNGVYFAVPWAGAGGQLGVIPLAATGRLPTRPATVETGSAIGDFDFSPANDNVLVTGHEDGHLKVWLVDPELYKQRSNLRDKTADLTGHMRKVTHTLFSPTAEGVVCSIASDMTMRVWDIEAASEALRIDGLSDMVQSLIFSYDGSLAATYTRDKKLSLWDLRARTAAASCAGHAGSKEARLAWMGDSPRLFSAGFSRSSERELGIWDSRKLDKALCLKTMDTASGVITPIYDCGTGVVFLTGKGDVSTKMFELVDEDPFMHYLTAFQTTTPMTAIAPLPKTACSIRDVEIMQALKLTPGGVVERLAFKVPRTRLEFFQDDVFPPHPDRHPVLAASDWLAGQTRPPTLVSLCPDGMATLSGAPPVVREVVRYEPGPKVLDAIDMREKTLGGYYDQTLKFKEDANTLTPDEKGEGAAADEW